jgi:hypothetical protein
VSASASATDTEVTEVLKASDVVKTVHCVKQWAVMDGTPGVVWCCDDIGCGDTKRASLLDKRAGEKGISVVYNPAEQPDGAIKVGVTVTEGEVAPMAVAKADPEPVKEEEPKEP